MTIDCIKTGNDGKNTHIYGPSLTIRDVAKKANPSVPATSFLTKCATRTPFCSNIKQARSKNGDGQTGVKLRSNCFGRDHWECDEAPRLP
ncbi:hypothetical protein SKAU_G00182830 [Synaphobranchus kaupii]|uniref:Uncharacterized protein n=1 Tax=Synaphobranchus kaupii TaxID=118154 RepID=A0A9Q1FC76_SYNKA|nr:hypothetical protein SKAU_G00182830 [Synaphobranchus kaupii]